MPLTTAPGSSPTTEGSTSSRTHCPVTGSSLGRFDVATADEVGLAIARARDVQVKWAATPVRERVERMQAALDVVLARREELLERLAK